MKMQLCVFKKTREADFEKGVAVLEVFGLSDVKYILNTKGEKQKVVWEYKLQNSPLGYIDTDYQY